MTEAKSTSPWSRNIEARDAARKEQERERIMTGIENVRRLLKTNPVYSESVNTDENGNIIQVTVISKHINLGVPSKVTASVRSWDELLVMLQHIEAAAPDLRIAVVPDPTGRGGTWTVTENTELSHPSEK